VVKATGGCNWEMGNFNIFVLIAAYKWIHLTEDEGVTILFDIRDVIIRNPEHILLQFVPRKERNGSVR